MMAMGLGWAFFWSSGIALGLALAFILFLHAKARFEEGLLCARFQGYPAYAARVPRYVPRWKGSQNGTRQAAPEDPA